MRSNEDSGAEVIRQVLAGRNKKANIGGLARDLGLSGAALEAFSRTATAASRPTCLGRSRSTSLTAARSLTRPSTCSGRSSARRRFRSASVRRRSRR